MTPGNGLAKRELAEDREPWEKQPWESHKAFHHFALYRDLGFARTLKRTFELEGQSSNYPLAQRNRWPERVEAYDMMVDARFRAQREDERERLERGQLAAGGALLATGLRRILGDSEDPSVVPLHPNQLEPQDVARFVEAGVRTQRLAAGLATDHVRNALSVTTTDLQRTVQTIVDRALARIPPEQHEDFLREITEAA